MTRCIACPKFENLKDVLKVNLIKALKEEINLESLDDLSRDFY